MTQHSKLGGVSFFSLCVNRGKQTGL
uniref:Uncharacterized protein n=1 Tax=Anguilla anguilla TaxID=7936 RepID=A0A0E9PK12_ANGAN